MVKIDRKDKQEYIEIVKLFIYGSCLNGIQLDRKRKM